MKYVFVQTSHNWADEFDFEGCYVEEYASFKAKLDSIEKAYDDGDIDAGNEYYFGTNEALTFDDFDSFMRGVTYDSCSDVFADEFKKLAPYGVGINLVDSMVEAIDEDD